MADVGKPVVKCLEMARKRCPAVQIQRGTQLGRYLGYRDVFTVEFVICIMEVMHMSLHFFHLLDLKR